ncbi:UDP-N-acetylglucosamine 2-epimerase (hydrolyzing) [Patescibacteria group bacterium]|nr:UDP-N-acetylglucosamine 2-epimerase (hydrolyzing) [Patescibacteria group bacterium]
MRKNNKEKRKICFPILSRAYYGRRKLLLEKLNNHPRFDLQLVVGGAVLLDKYSHDLFSEIENSGFNISEKLFNVIEGGNHVVMAKTASLIGLEITNVFYKTNPDIVIVEGDRFEQLAVAMSAAYLNKTLVHIEGGDVSGNIDESVRHAITKLSHIHFVTNKDSYSRVVRMGENPKYVFNVGSLDVEYAASMKDPDIASLNKLINAKGAGSQIDLNKDFLIVIYHPVTSDTENRRNTEILFESIADLGLPILWFWPNNDAGTNEVSESIRHFREKYKSLCENFRFFTNLSSEDFISILKKAACVVGNSSAGIKECSYFGIPVVNVGSRQCGRLRAENVVDVGHNFKQIKKAVKEQVSVGKYKSFKIYHRPNSSAKVIDTLSKINLYTQKRFYGF